MKKKFSSMGRVAIALVLALSLVLAMGAPVAATDPGDEVEFETWGEGDDEGTAEWSTTKVDVGNYSVKLTAPWGGLPGLPSVWTKSAAKISYGETLSTLAAVPTEDIIFRLYSPPGASTPFGLLYIDTDLDGKADVLMHAKMEVPTPDSWDDGLAQHDHWSPVGYDEGIITTPVEVDGTSYGFQGGFPGIGDEMSLSAWAAKGLVWADAVVLYVGSGYCMGDTPAYVDDIIIDNTHYAMEPPLPPLDEDYYAVDDQPIVTIYDGAANLDRMAIDIIDFDDATPPNALVHVDSTTDTTGDDLVLTETGADTGVFDGSFTLLGAAPAYRDLDQIVVSEGDTITLTYEGLTVTALVDETPPTIDNLSPADGTIEYTTTPTISADLSDASSGIDVDSIVMKVNGVVVTTVDTGTTEAITATYTVSPELAAGDIVEVTVNVDDLADNAADTASWSFTIASALNATVDPTTWTAGNVGDLTVTITGVGESGPDGDGDNPLNWVKVEVSAPVEQSLATGEYYFNGGAQNLDDADAGTDTTVTFSGLLPNDASADITVTVTGELDEGEETAVGPVTLTIPVSGFIVTDITPSTFQIIDTTSDISVTVTTKAGEAVSASLVTITAAEPDGFQKDVAGDEELESFQTITINGLTSEIQYDEADAETCSVTGGIYQVTGIKFAELGGVAIEVGEVGSIQAKFDPAFSVRGVDVYEVLLDPDTVTAGIETEVAVTVTEDGNPVTAIDSIELDSAGLLGATSSGTGEYTITVPATPEAGTPAVNVTGEGGQKYGTTDLTIGLPTIDYTIYEGEEERNVMLVDTGYTLDVSVNDALGEPLDGYLWVGTYDEEAGFDELTTDPELVELVDGAAEFTVTAPVEACSLFWMIGSIEPLAETQALLLTPSVAVEEFCYDLNPTEATVGVETTYTVTDNYGDPAADRDVKIVTPAIETVEKTTGPAGTPLAGKFIYTAPEAGDYYVSVKLETTWQDPITVTVSEVEVTLVSIAAEPSEVSLEVGDEEQLAITATYSDASTAPVTADATYISSDTLVATVSAAGLITAVAEGSATVTVTYETETADVLVTVSVWDPIVAYDADDDGVIDKTEAVDAVWDYFDETITKDQAIEVLWLYFG